MEEKAPAEPLDMLCEPDNARAFNAAARQHLPGFHALAKALHQRGMVAGLRGATLRDTATADAHHARTAHLRAQPVTSNASVEADLRQWYADAGLKYPHGGR